VSAFRGIRTTPSPRAIGWTPDKLRNVRRGAQEWLENLSSELEEHRAVLRGLMSESQGDRRIRVLIVGCSLGRGTADARSDIDAFLGVEEWRSFLSELGPLLGRLGVVVDLYHQTLKPPQKEPYQRSFVQYRSGVQLDLVVAPVAPEMFMRADWVVLHDPDDRIHSRNSAGRASLEEVEVWAYQGLEHLSACAKYIARGSLWEAHEQLHQARGQIWRLWAVANDVTDPQFGLTAVLDTPKLSTPPAIEETVARLDRQELARAAVVCADLFDEIWPRAVAAINAPSVPAPPLAAYVRTQIRSL
jgi:hypothetical protein